MFKIFSFFFLFFRGKEISVSGMWVKVYPEQQCESTHENTSAGFDEIRSQTCFLTPADHVLLLCHSTNILM